MNTRFLSLRAAVWMIAAMPSGSIQRASQPPRYSIVTTKDLSLGAVRRFNVRVRLSKHYSRSEVEAVAKAIVTDWTKREPINALSMMFYSPGGTVTGAWDVALVDWAPHGQWSEASTVHAGEYSSFSYSISYRPPPARADTASALRASGAKGLHGTPLPLGAKLVDRGTSNPASGRSHWERYQIAASAADISAYFNREMSKAGWLRDGLSSANELFLNNGNTQLDILIAAKGGTFTLSGS